MSLNYLQYSWRPISPGRRRRVFTFQQQSTLKLLKREKREDHMIKTNEERLVEYDDF